MFADRIKPTHKPIKAYYAALKAVAKTGAKHEMAVRAAFQELLTTLARKRGWTFVPERPVTVKGHRVVPDGTILDESLIPRGHWEAKDSNDDLEAEVEKKKAKAYPLVNIIFEDTRRAILYQNGIEVSRKELTDPEQLCQLLNVFLEYARPPVHNFEQAVAKFKEDVPELAEGLQEKLAKAHKNNPKFKQAFADFFELCKTSLNPNISEAAVDEMLVQHLLTSRLFRTVFNRQDFTRRNVIAREVENVIDALHRDFDRTKFLESLDYFYKAIEAAAADLDDFSEKQAFMNTVYERFFQGYSVKVADTHGIVYTPQEIVDFMCASVEEVLQKEFKTTLGGKDVWILDPCTGTGNFMVNLINRIPLPELADAYKNRLFANEVMLLPYYISALNIEHAYHERMGDYEPFEGLCFVDSLDLAGSGRKELAFLSRENAQRVKRQQSAPITVIVGNPPYNANRKRENDLNPNRPYPAIDERVRATYGVTSEATNLNKLRDPYIRFLRWASDRLAGRDGLVCMITNNNFIDDKPFDGVRKALPAEFTRVLHIDLGGNVGRNPKLNGGTHNVFGIKLGVGITIAIKRASSKVHRVESTHMPMFATRYQKLGQLSAWATVGHADTKKIEHVNGKPWLARESDDLQAEFAELLPIASRAIKKARSGAPHGVVFTYYGPGTQTNRDEWVYDFDQSALLHRIESMSSVYNGEVDRWVREDEPTDLDGFLDVDERHIKWSSSLKEFLRRRTYVKVRDDAVRQSLWRPFTRKHLYFDPVLNHRPGAGVVSFPKENSSNIVLCSTGHSQTPFLAQIADCIPNEAVGGRAGSCFPFYVYDEDGSNRRENVTDWALKTFRAAYGDDSISKWDIFHYVYSILHHPGYRGKFKDCLKRELPRISFAGFERSAGVSAAPAGAPRARRKGAGGAPAPLAGEAPALQFRAFAQAGEKLCKLHLDYEKVDPWPLRHMESVRATYKQLCYVERMRLSKDRKSIKVNDYLSLIGIPERCFDYRLGNRSALEWVIDQYRVSEDKRSGIRSDPNRPDDPEYIVRLVGQVIRVSMETLDIIDGLPESYGGPLPASTVA